VNPFHIKNSYESAEREDSLSLAHTEIIRNSKSNTVGSGMLIVYNHILSTINH